MHFASVECHLADFKMRYTQKGSMIHDHICEKRQFFSQNAKLWNKMDSSGRPDKSLLWSILTKVTSCKKRQKNDKP